MTLTALPDGYVSDDFEFPYGELVFADALVMLASVYDSLTAAEIDAMKQARFDNWVAIISTPLDQEIING